MAILALDTSTSVGSVAIASGANVLAEASLAVRATRSEAVLPEIERLMVRTGLRPAEIDAVVVGSGPGSFTGVRIAASLAKGICFARRVPLYAYSSLAAVAVGARRPGPVCALFDAKRGQVYAAGYRVSGGVEELFPPVAAPLREILERTDPADDWCFAGDGAGPGEAMIREAGGRILAPDAWYPHASTLVWLAHTSPDAGHVRDPSGWEPRYVRLPAAQRELAD